MRERDPRAVTAALSRRRLLVLAALVPAAATGLAACSGAGPAGADGPDPLIALADAARADAALAAAVMAADPALFDRVEPLRVARAEHAAALQAAIAAADPAATVPPAPPPPEAGDDPLRRIRAAVEASAAAAATLVPDLPAQRVGLVAAISACCATYAAVLT